MTFTPTANENQGQPLNLLQNIRKLRRCNPQSAAARPLFFPLENPPSALSEPAWTVRPALARSGGTLGVFLPGWRRACEPHDIGRLMILTLVILSRDPRYSNGAFQEGPRFGFLPAPGRPRRRRERRMATTESA